MKLLIALLGAGLTAAQTASLSDRGENGYSTSGVKWNALSFARGWADFGGEYGASTYSVSGGSCAVEGLARATKARTLPEIHLLLTSRSSARHKQTSIQDAS